MSSPAGASSAYVASAAVVSGYAAWKIAQLVGPVVDRMDGLTPPTRAALVDAVQALRLAGDAWRAEVGEVTARVQSEATEVAEVFDPARPSSWPAAMDAAQVAEVLKVSDRQARNLARRMGACKRRGEWSFERAEVLAYVEGRQPA